MLVRRLAAAGLLAAAAVPAVPAPASAHGSPTTPISRNTACAGNGTRRATAACEAALKATGGFLGAYDNLRLANVNGDDRARVPDGKLCSGGLDAYRGLDLPRDDFPSTTVRSGQNLKISYRGTIPHQGSFRLYLTKEGFSPTGELAWGDLGRLDEIKDPPLTGGAYKMAVRLPQRTGRHILYVVWQTSSTPDTYYSCSDLVFAAVEATTAPTAPSALPTPTTPAATASPAAPSPAAASALAAISPSASAPDEPEPARSVTAQLAAADGGTVTLGHWLVGGAVVVAALTAIAAGAARLRRRRDTP
ncbi:lytic polysaccharide monooxygenase [Actinoplanes sp. NEAU-A12]|uniref:Lytic polysaccharide monooxygenase n=1 Tax=Actinoplanes sandaracinus TaxID=3045177 RepID=A0ABT6WJT7_9ACTN|nr:lytic polysaccharide monooxygenase [Actinoplanes sandaracinus]MDI6099988.1 lytic polysaccharide monooxygenase [Actinoplanes sandaracinus]